MTLIKIARDRFYFLFFVDLIIAIRVIKIRIRAIVNH